MLCFEHAKKLQWFTLLPKGVFGFVRVWYFKINSLFGSIMLHKRWEIECRKLDKASNS